MSKMKQINFHNHLGGGSHLPLLIKLLEMTDGPVLELGMGMFSTAFLHWACYDKKRKLVSCESKPDFMELFDFHDKREEGNDISYHQVVFVEDWDEVDLSGHWSVVLVDHAPGPRRKEEIRRLANSADYIVVHDTNGRNNWHYNYTEIYPLFKYRYDYDKAYPFTTVLSNFKDLKDL